MIGTIVGAIFIGLIVGALARLILPGRQNIGVIMTILLGAIGSFAGSWITYRLISTANQGKFELTAFLVGIIVAVVLIAIYVGLTGRRGTRASKSR
ncbi:MAG TPA: GlsB/YeaQ/YmgE family stress response membrane protein [Mycobacterium sp.]|nr:GlsB/YeaQ/YmgE family stress response membrane protein [Mycobacterium sp.]